jgi:hypothetical protein
MNEKHYDRCPHCGKGIVINFEWWTPDINVDVDPYPSMKKVGGEKDV